MFDFNVLAETTLMFMLLMIPGFILGKYKILGKEAIAGVGEIITRVALPCLVIVKMLETNISSCGIANVIACIVHVPTFLLLISFVSRLIFKKRPVEHFCSVFPNCGAFGIPLAVAMFPDKPEVVILLSIWSTFDPVIMLTFGMNILSEEKQNRNILSVLFKPISIAAVLGMILSLFDFGSKFPMSVAYTEYFANVTTSLSMTVLGYEISNVSWKSLFFRFETYAVSIVRLFISPILALGIAYIFHLISGTSLSDTFFAAVFLATGVATASMASTLANDCGRDATLAAVLTVGTTIFSVITMPLMSLVYEMIF